ncbi:MAG: nucleoside kinase, partial [Spirochaetales bacterium]
MREISLTVKGKKIKMPAFSTVRDILIKAGVLPEEIQAYEDNPVVGSIVNGELKPCGSHVAISCTVEPVYAFEDFGRRIYRHSICFLLCYAATLVIPKRQLVI